MGITYVVLKPRLSNSENIFLLKNQSSRTGGMRFYVLPIGFPTQCGWGEELVKKTSPCIRTWFMYISLCVTPSESDIFSISSAYHTGFCPVSDHALATDVDPSVTETSPNAMARARCRLNLENKCYGN